MTREQLDQANAAAVTRHTRALGDDPRNPPQALLDDLAANAERWARELNPAKEPPAAERITVEPKTTTPRRPAARRRAT